MFLQSVPRTARLLRLLLPALPAAAMHRSYTLDVAAPLLRTQAFIDGRWVSAESHFPVLDPATGSELARVSDCGPAEAKQAVDAAYRAFHTWKRVTAKVGSGTRRSEPELDAQSGAGTGTTEPAECICCVTCDDCCWNVHHHVEAGSKHAQTDTRC